MVGDGCPRYFEALVCMVVDGGGEGAKFLIQLVFKFLDGLSEVFLHDERVGVSGVTHGSYFVCEHFFLYVHGRGGLPFCWGMCLYYFLGEE